MNRIKFKSNMTLINDKDSEDDDYASDANGHDIDDIENDDMLMIWPQSQFPQSCVCERFIYSNWSAYSPAGKYVDRFREYTVCINRSHMSDFHIHVSADI
jgi:hypothetical protein